MWSRQSAAPGKPHCGALSLVARTLDFRTIQAAFRMAYPESWYRNNNSPLNEEGPCLFMPGVGEYKTFGK